MLVLNIFLGFKKRGETLEIDPCIPGKWTDFTIKYRYYDTDYIIEVKNPEGVNTGVKKVIVDGKVCDDGKVQLVNDKDTHKVEVYMGKK